MPHQLAPAQQQGQIVIYDNGQSYLVTRLQNGQLHYAPFPQNPQAYPQSQPHDPTAMALAVSAIALVAVLGIGGICYAVGYNAGERSAARVLVCDRQTDRNWFSDNSQVTCK